ncbi:MAG: hypothetical protein MI892_06025 [Desulfobacterales bacterium]|nr:hypothetical protein [Desulfobacterales bacterium]
MITCFSRDSYTSLINDVAGKDLRLAKVINQFGSPPFFGRSKGFACLVRIILEQQVSLTSAFHTFKRLETGLGELTADRICSLNPDQIKAFGITRQKTVYIKHLADKITNGHLDLDELDTLPDAQVKAKLTSLKGIGPWTADIYLIMGLKRMDVFPSGDLAIRKAMAGLGFNDQDAEAAEKAALAFAPYRSIFSFLLWHWYICTNTIKLPG